MPYDFITNGYSNGYTSVDAEVHIVDLRSDTISKPTSAMREAMATALVGDDVYGEDPTVNLLIRKSCELFGKEDGILVPSGTMANLIAIMVHCRERGSELICGDNSHTFRFEQGGPAQLAGVQQALVKNKEDGTFCLQEMCSRIRINPDCHEPYTSLIVVENTHNMCGGKILPLEWLDKLTSIAKSHNIAVHMDGARVTNAAVASKVELSRIVRDIDSVCFCLSKSLGAPIGSVLLGTKAFIERAKRVRKVLGGGMRQSGIIAAAGIVALDTMMDQLRVDHEHSYKIAKAIHNTHSKLFKVDLQSVETNILMMYLDSTKVTADDFLQRLYDVYPSDPVKVRIRASTRDISCIRFVFYWEITDEDVEMALMLRPNMYYMHGGAPAHNARAIRIWLQGQFWDRIIANNGPIAWPARSPDLNPLDFFVWGFLHLQQDVRNKINAAVQLIIPEMLQSVKNAIPRRLQRCIG